ncbi:Uncharacterised protein [Mycobacterium tuberculosis]|uniref:Uncharacterized protein n=1 Tax=Mycobacterium tuberculosis TaxID=1773 RepID=A0A655ANK2_MYCTX|nr:Uncharacterised protein [Mycobacterium tuberculosis]CKT79831.1 Uncharacterised protein [Mycobacterium tuberculosis]
MPAAAANGIVSSETVTASSMTTASSRSVPRTSELRLNTRSIVRHGKRSLNVIMVAPSRSRVVAIIAVNCSWLLGSFGLGAGDVGHEWLGAVHIG